MVDSKFYGISFYLFLGYYWAIYISFLDFYFLNVNYTSFLWLDFDVDLDADFLLSRLKLSC